MCIYARITIRVCAYKHTRMCVYSYAYVRILICVCAYKHTRMCVYSYAYVRIIRICAVNVYLSGTVVERKRRNMNETKRRRTIQNICLVTMQSFTEGSLEARTFIKTYLSHQCREKLIAKRDFNNTMDKHAVKVVKGNETVGHLPRKFSRIVWYFLAHSGEISVEVIDRR